MNSKLKVIIGIAFSFLFIPLSVCAEITPEKIIGEYTAKKNFDGYVVLKLNSDQTAIIEDWLQGGARKHYGNWSILNNEVVVRYRDIDQILTYHDELRLLEYKSFKKIRGLKTSRNNKIPGFLDSVRVIDKIELNKLIDSGNIIVPTKVKKGYINFYSIFIVTFFLSAFLGRKNPLLSAIGCVLIIASIGYSLHETSYLVYHVALGFISCFLWSIFFRWLTLKGRMGTNDTKIKFLIGFSSGRGTRNTVISSHKNSRTLN